MTSMQGRSLKISFVWFCLITCLNAKPSAEPAPIQAYHKYQQHQLQQQQQLYHEPYLYDKQQQQQQQQQRLSYHTQQHYMTQQQQPLPATSLGLIQQQPQKQQQQQLAALTANYPVKPSQVVQTAQSITIDDDHQYVAEVSHHMETTQRPTLHKRKRRPQLKLTVTTNNPNKLYRRGQTVEVATIQTEKEPRRNSQKQAQPTLDPQQIPLPSFEAEATKTKEGNIKANETVYPKPVADLKSLLKQSGGSISLSEILQRKNLTLEDLIKGKQQALQALQTTGEPYNETKEQTIKPVRSNAREDNGERLITLTRQRAKLYGNAARPLTLKRKDYESTIKSEASIVATTKTPKNFATYASSYKKSLNQRNTLKPEAVITTTVSSLPIVEERESDEEEEEDLENQQHREKLNANNSHNAEDKLSKTNQSEEIEGEEEEDEEEGGQFEDYSAEKTETTTVLATTTTTTTKTSTDKPFRQTRLNTTLRRNTTPNLRNSSYNYRTSRRSYPSSTSTTTTAIPSTTTPSDIVTTTASSSTMNLTPKASYTLNSDDLKERLQESLLKNLIEKEKQQKKPDKILPAATTTIAKDSDDDDDELENFLEEAVKTKIVTKTTTTSTLKTTAKPLTAVSTSLSNTVLSIPRGTVVAEAYIPDFDNIDDRTDLLELIEDHRSGNSLFKVLQQRNMSLEQLIEHRKRGSSQLHLATIVQNPRGLFPDKKVVLQDNLDIVTAFENFPHFNLLNLKSVKPDDIKTDSQGSSYFTSIIDIEPTDEIYKGNDASNNAQVHIRNQKVSSLRIVADRNEKSLDINTPWNTLALASLPISNAGQSQTAKLRNYYLTQPKLLLDLDSNEMPNDLGNKTIAEEKPDYQVEEETNTPLQAAVRVEDNSVEEIIVNEIVQGHDLVDLELSGHGFKRSPSAVAVSPVAMGERHKQHTFYTNMPAGIKSAIVASATIVLTAVITFMIVFAVCRWKQRHVRGPLDNNSGFSSLVRSYNAMKHKLATATGTRETGRCSSSLQPMSGRVAMVATITTTTPHSITHTDCNNGSHSNTSQQLQRQSSLLMLDKQRPSLASNKNSEGHTTKKYTTSLSSGLTKASNRSCKNTTTTTKTTVDNSNGCDSSGGGGGVGLALMTLGCHTGSHFGSTTSLALSLKSSTAKLNAPDTNSPGVQEYFFDTVRDSF